MSEHLSLVDDTKAIAPGTLYLVGTPIGNLEDITLRSLRVLQQVDWIAAEDTRRTGQLLKHFQIGTRTLSYHEHNRAQRIPDLIAKLQADAAIALVTDAGMPAISDPGEDLVRACIAAEISVVPIPGPTAFVTALVAAGLPTDRFMFEGFLPTQASVRHARIAEISARGMTTVLYEAPHRLLKTLEDLSHAIPRDRPIVLARELTKKYEEFWRGSLQEAIARVKVHPPRGEFAIAIGGRSETAPHLSDEEILAQVQSLMKEGVSRSQASRQVAQATGRGRRDIYDLALMLPPIEEMKME
ncbi:MAG: 16S rRNA (cytidine(1402)-2'-O)-methyltransferase [Cyanobacteria bacterium P01_F01_bin.33]